MQSIETDMPGVAHAPFALTGLAVAALSGRDGGHGLYHVAAADRHADPDGWTGIHPLPDGEIPGPESCPFSSTRHGHREWQQWHPAGLVTIMPGVDPRHTRSTRLGLPATMRNPARSTFPTNGLLLALDGRCLDRSALPLALRLCKRYGKRLHILLVNPPKPATLMLGKFLQDLEEEEVDYRLTSTVGTLADELPLYVHHFENIATVLLDCLEQREARLHSTLEDLRREGYRVLTLVDRENDSLLGNAEWKVAT